MTFPELQERFERAQLSRGRCPVTLGRGAREMQRLLAFWGPELSMPADLQPHHLSGYQQALQARGLAPSTSMLVMRRIVGILRWAVRHGLLLIDPSRQLKLRKVPNRVRRPLSVREVEAILEHPDADTPEGLRTRALLETFYGTGVRLSECRRLQLNDFNGTAQTLWVRRGKGGRSRLLPVLDGLAAVLERYLSQARPQLVQNSRESALFVSNRGRSLGRTVLAQLVTEAGQGVGIQGLSSHRLRHALATHLLAAGADLRAIQALLGHSQSSTTDRYAQLSLRVLQAEHRRYHPRARRRRAT